MEEKTVEIHEQEEEVEHVDVDVEFEDVEEEPKKKSFWPTKEQVLHGLKVVGTVAAVFAAGAAATVVLGCHLANKRDQQLALSDSSPEETE